MSDSTTHGISLGIQRKGDRFWVVLTAIGKLTHNDYEVMTPILENSIASVEDPHIRMLVDLREFDGWELRAAWDDFKLGMKYGREFERIAMVGEGAWQDWAAKIGSWFIAGEIAHFEDLEAAHDWLTAS
ncbi:STAS/SEC14 domain-containing protein [Oceanobacter mangrovi]|uniref:STAS/SEC14 domain-containing protein n=1 Tax=Oceanobacter mangrovi TaxID=2862510 RepID=UPI001C8E6B10|nr:STAS/SEC14 domain-containing protein [Oceanobacter mangrovi]